jgi:hypothetical protein
MKTDVRYQNGFLYEHHGAWYVRYYQRTSKEDGTRQLNHASKHLGRSKTFAIFLMSSCAEHHSCKQSIVIDSVQIRE